MIAAEGNRCVCCCIFTLLRKQNLPSLQCQTSNAALPFRFLLGLQKLSFTCTPLCLATPCMHVEKSLIKTSKLLILDILLSFSRSALTPRQALY